MRCSAGCQVLTAILVPLLAELPPVVAGPGVVLNELSASNRAILADENGDFPDWFELFNAGDTAAGLAGWGVSDDAKKPFKWRFGNATVEAGGFLTVFASGKDRQPSAVAARTPESVSGLILRLRADAVVTNNTAQVRRLGASVFVKRWLDQSPAGNAAVAVPDGVQPTWLPSGANGHPVLRFDGINDQLVLSRIPATNDFCLIAVARPTRSHETDPENASGVGGTAGQRYLFGAQHGGDFNGGAGVSLGTNGVAVYEHGSSYMPALAAYAGPIGAKFHVVTVNYTSKHPSLFVDGALARAGLPSPRAQVTAPVEIGAGAYGAFAGDIAEVLVFNRALAADERRGLEKHLASQYGVPVSQPYHTSFQLSAGGEELVLTRADGTRADFVQFGIIPSDVSYGRQPDASGGWYFFAQPTPGVPNTTPGSAEYIAAPVLTPPGGFHSHALELTMTVENAGAEIRYTLDGSEPTSTSTLYQTPLSLKSRVGTANQLANLPTVPGGLGANGEVFKGWAIRARAFKAGALPSSVVTQTYWIDARGRARYSVPVVSLVTDKRNFFGADIGIYVPGNNSNYNQRGPEWERPVHVELCETDNRLVIAQEADVKIHGNTSQGFPIKGLDLDATGLRGRTPFRYRIFPDRERDEFEHVLLRPTGHDQQYAFMRDELMQSLAAETGAESQAARLCVVFINGEYWGLHYLKEKEDTAFVAHYSGRTADELDYLEGYAAAKAGTTQHYDSMLQFIQTHDLAQEANYAEVATRMDLPNYIDYKACEVFFYRWDIGNHRLWRPQTSDGRWRWLQFDNDVGWGGFWAVQPAWQFNMLAADLSTDGSLNGHNNETTTFLLRRLMSQPTFKRDFINRLADLMNTVLHPVHTTNRIQEFARQLDPEMAEHIRRWRYPGSIAEWRSNVEYLRTYAANRTTFVRQHLQQRFGLGPPVALTLSVSDPRGGSIRLNTLVVSNATDAPFLGAYFRNLPLPLAAQAAPGFRFAGWEGLPDASSAEQTFVPTAPGRLTARFEHIVEPVVRLTLARDPTATSIQVAVVGAPGASVVLEASEDLVRWDVDRTVTLNAEGAATIVLRPVSEPSIRFFRARVP